MLILNISHKHFTRDKLFKKQRSNHMVKHTLIKNT